MNDKEFEEALDACRTVRRSLEELSRGGVDGLFDQRWINRNFREKLGIPVENALEKVVTLEDLIEKRDLASIENLNPPIDELANYYDHLIHLVQHHKENSKKHNRSVDTIWLWRNSVGRLAQFVCRIE